MAYGFSCWQYYAPTGAGCRNSIELQQVDDPREAELLAGMAGWTIGHFDGQGQIACPDCRNSVWDAKPLGYDPSVIDAVGAIACAIGSLTD